MSALIWVPSVARTEMAPRSPGATPGSEVRDVPSRNSTPDAVSWRRSSPRRAAEYFEPSRSVSWSSRITCLPGQAATISPASSTPTGPAPTISTRPAPASAPWADRMRALAAAELSSSLLAGKG